MAEQEKNDCVPKDMSPRQYAAIELRVPDSGTPWLDKMIREALRVEIAKQALAGIKANQITVGAIGAFSEKSGRAPDEILSTACFVTADAMLEALNA
jgi:hypothetical protein